jgi:hypothetical protein
MAMPSFSGLVDVQDVVGTTTVSIDGNAGNLYLGGAKADGSGGQDGDLHVRDSFGNTTILLDGTSANVTLGGTRADGSPGTDGDIAVRNSQGIRTIELRGQTGDILLGGPKPDGSAGQDGDLSVRDAKGVETIRLDGASGEIKIRNWSIAVADYVFAQGYPLRPLTDLSSYVRRHNHLPDVPSAQDIARHGIDLSTFAMTLLRKVEELTLYAVQQAEEVSLLKARVRELERERVLTLEGRHADSRYQQRGTASSIDRTMAELGEDTAGRGVRVPAEDDLGGREDSR